MKKYSKKGSNICANSYKFSKSLKLNSKKFQTLFNSFKFELFNELIINLQLIIIILFLIRNYIKNETNLNSSKIQLFLSILLEIIFIAFYNLKKDKQKMKGFIISFCSFILVNYSLPKVYNFETSILISNILILMINILFNYSLNIKLILSFLLNSYFITILFQKKFLNLINFDIIACNLLMIIIYYFFQKVLLQLWIIIDSLEKTNKNYLRLIMENNNPIFLTKDDKLKTIIFKNNKANALISKLNLKINSINNNFGFKEFFSNQGEEKFNNLIIQIKQKKLVAFNKEIKEEDEEENHELFYEFDYENSFLSNKENIEKNLKKKKFSYKIFCLPIIFNSKKSFIFTFEENFEKKSHFSLIKKGIKNLSYKISEIFDLLENDFIKWSNLISQGIIKEYEIKNLSNIIFCVENLKEEILRNNEIIHKYNLKRNLIDFNLKNSLIKMFEMVFIKAVQKNCEISLKFEKSFPSQVCGNYKGFKMVKNYKFYSFFIYFY